MSVFINEQGGRRTIYYPDDRHLRMFDAFGPTQISVETGQTPQARKRRSVADRSPGQTIHIHPTPQSLLTAYSEKCRPSQSASSSMFIRIAEIVAHQRAPILLGLSLNRAARPGSIPRNSL